MLVGKGGAYPRVEHLEGASLGLAQIIQKFKTNLGAILPPGSNVIKIQL